MWAFDPDHDGANNGNEFQAGTNPTNAASVLRITAIAREANSARVTWTTVGGKSYRLQADSPAASGSFTNNFSDLSPLISIPGTGESTTNYLDTSGVTNTRAKYYRVRLGP